jgi:thiamine pyridinylase
MSRIRISAALLCVAFAASACGDMQTSPTASASTAKAPAERFQLRVSLYPWVPDAESLVRWIEADFEASHPTIDLVVRPLNRSYDWMPEYTGDLAYEIDKTVQALTGGGGDAQHLVEVDAMILGELAARGALAPFGLPGADFLPFARQAVTYGGVEYGVPHWTCGYFVISEQDAVQDARNVHQLVGTLRDARTPRVDLVGDLDGSWDAITVYLDGHRDTWPGRSLQDALAHTELDPAVEASFRALGSACEKDGVNHCGSDGVDQFATGGADALIGYSERLNPILSHPGRTVGQLHVSSATLGGGDHPALFTDALVMSPGCSTAQCSEAARQFAAYYTSDRVFETVLMSRDAGPAATPRYLLPSTASAFAYGAVAADPLYRQLRREIEGGVPFPNHGLLAARDRGAIQARLREALGITGN